MKLLIRWFVNALALFVAVSIVPGIYIADDDGLLAYALVALTLGLLNAVLRPLLKMLTCPLIILTLGLFTLVVNALVFLLASWLVTTFFDVGFYINGFWPAFWGSLIVSIVSIILNAFVRDEDED